MARKYTGGKLANPPYDHAYHKKIAEQIVQRKRTLNRIPEGLEIRLLNELAHKERLRIMKEEAEKSIASN